MRESAAVLRMSARVILINISSWREGIAGQIIGQGRREHAKNTAGPYRRLIHCDALSQLSMDFKNFFSSAGRRASADRTRQAVLSDFTLTILGTIG